MHRIPIPEQILGNIDFANTLNGGRSESLVWVNRAESGYEVFIRIPGVTLSSLVIEVSNGHLWVYTMHEVLKGREEKDKFLPFTISDLLIPSDVNINSMRAAYTKERNFRIFLPFTEPYERFDPF